MNGTVLVQLSAGNAPGGPQATGTAATPAGGDGAGDPFDPDDDGPYQVHGVAIPEDGLTFGRDEEWTYWPEQVGRDAEGLLSGRNIVDLHPEEPTNDDVVGEVTGEKYITGLGLAWTGEVDSRKRAKQVHRGRLDSSPYMFAFDGGDAAPPAEAPDQTRVASGVSKIRDIGLVPDGAIEGSEAKPGVHPDIEGSEPVEAALSEGFGGTHKPGDDENDSMSDGSGGDGAGSDDGTGDLEELRSRIEDLEDENEQLRERNGILREPYVEQITAGTDLSAEDVNLTAEDLAERFAEEDDTGGAEEDDGASAGEARGSEGEAAALSAAPLTAQRGSPPGGEGRTTALSEGETGGSGGEDGTSDPDESREVLEARRQALGDRGTDEYREKLDDQIASLGGGS